MSKLNFLAGIIGFSLLLSTACSASDRVDGAWKEIRCDASEFESPKKHGITYSCNDGNSEASIVKIHKDNVKLFEYDFGVDDRWIRMDSDGVFLLDVKKIPGISGLVTESNIVNYTTYKEKTSFERQEKLSDAYKDLYFEALRFNSGAPCDQLDSYCEMILIKLLKIGDINLECKELNGKIFERVPTQALAKSAVNLGINATFMQTCRGVKHAN